jgi:hypothetical protein
MSSLLYPSDWSSMEYRWCGFSWLCFSHSCCSSCSCCLDSRRIQIGVSRPNRLTIGAVTRFDNSSITLYGVGFFSSRWISCVSSLFGYFFLSLVQSLCLDYFSLVFIIQTCSWFIGSNLFFPLLLYVRAYLYPLLWWWIISIVFNICLWSSLVYNTSKCSTKNFNDNQSLNLKTFIRLFRLLNLLFIVPYFVRTWKNNW